VRTEAEVLRTTPTGAVLGLLLIGVPGGTAQAGSIEFAALHATKVDDLNGNGVRDAGDPGIAGWSIDLRNTTDSVMWMTATDADGNYGFTDLEPGSWELSEALVPGWVQTFPSGDVSTAWTSTPVRSWTVSTS